jgi:DNA-binding NarL/FixJ family response regulator
VDDREPVEILKLTHREQQVLVLIAEGESTKRIAAKLNVSFKTAATHRYNIAQKVGNSNPAILTRYAIRSGLIEA